MKEKIRDFIKAVREKDDSGVRKTLKEVLKEKVIKRMNDNTEE